MKESSFCNQHDSFENEDLKKATCGVCCVAMIVTELTQTVVLPLQIVEHLSALHKNRLAVAKRDYSEGGITLPITLGSAEEVYPQPFYICDPDQTFQPAFSLKGGYDHRISEILFKLYDLKAKYFEDISLDEVFNKLKDGEFEYAMVSVMLPNQSRHLIVIYYDNEENKHYSVDPLFASTDYCVSIDKLDLLPIYNGLVTLVSKVL